MTIPLWALLLLLLAGAATGFLAWYAWWRREVSGAAAFAVLMGAVTLWTLTYLAELLTPTCMGKLLWTDLEFTAIALSPPAWLAFAMQYTGLEKRLTSRFRWGILALPTVTVLMVLTNPWHRLMWAGFTCTPGRTDLQNVAAPWFWVHTYYSYLLILAGIALYVRMYVRSTGLYRRQALIAVLGALLPFGINMLYVFSLVPPPPMDFTPFTFTLSGLIFGWGLFRFHMLDVVPVARDLLIESMPDGMFVVDEHGRIVDINPAMRRILGLLGSEPVIGLPATRFLRPWRDLVRKYLRTEQATGEVSAGQGENRRWYDLRMSPLHNRRGRTVGRLVLLRDITERKRAAEELRQANEEIRRFNEELESMVQQRTEELQQAYQKLEALDRTKTDFIQVAAHELRTPLTVLRGYTQVLLHDPLLAEHADKRALLEGILSGEQRLHQIVNDLLDVSRIDARSLKVSMEPVRLYDIAISAFGIIAEAATARHIAFSADDIRSLPLVHGDPDLLRRALYHLFTNAVKYTPDGGRVWLEGRVLPEDKQVELVVADTGIGIAPEHLEMVFEKFYRTGEIAL
ncbi:MAG: PAS domain S-box protein, partial [Anaerolineae bacterium]